MNSVIIWIILAAIAGIVGNNSDRLSLKLFKRYVAPIEVDSSAVIEKTTEEEMQDTDSKLEDSCWTMDELGKFPENYTYARFELDKKIASYVHDLDELIDIGGTNNRRSYYYENIVKNYKLLNNQLFEIKFEEFNLNYLKQFRDGMNSVRRDILSLRDICEDWRGSIVIDEELSETYDTEVQLECLIKDLKPFSHFIEEDRLDRLAQFRKDIIRKMHDYFDAEIGKQCIKCEYCRSLKPEGYVEERFQVFINQFESHLEEMEAMIAIMDRESFVRLKAEVKEIFFDRTGFQL